MEVAADDQLFDLINELQSQSMNANRPTCWASRQRRSPNVDRSLVEGQARLFRDYFAQQPV